MSAEADPDVPPAGEQIHVPGPSLMPLLLAVGLTLALVGITTTLILTGIGVVITIPVLVRWIRSTRSDLAELPPGH
ncbi:MAG: hypothetical protein ACRDLP_06845 [Solirubrobacteraceae bacterium]